jgi:hypothetical protein
MGQQLEIVHDRSSPIPHTHHHKIVLASFSLIRTSPFLSFTSKVVAHVHTSFTATEVLVLYENTKLTDINSHTNTHHKFTALIDRETHAVVITERSTARAQSTLTAA